MFTMNGIGSLFEFAGGIGMFLYGMNRMADGMQKSAGGKMKSLLGYLTRNRFLAILQPSTPAPNTKNFIAESPVFEIN